MNKIITIKLKKDLKKVILQGNPWLYDQALAPANQNQEVSLCRIVSKKNEFVAWGFYSPNSQLAVRILSTKSQAPDISYYENLLFEAAKLRKPLNTEQNNCYRLVNGEGDLLPGFICDVYNKVAVIQFDGIGPYEFWDQDWLAKWILANTRCTSVFYKPRHDAKTKIKFWGENLASTKVEVKENNCSFFVDIEKGQKTGFFLDQRENREYIKNISADKSILNLFSYTGGFSISAGIGGASSVTSVDVAQGALDLATKNWQLNSLDPEKHKTIKMNIFEQLREFNEQFDVVICDPPSLAKSEKTKSQAILKYIDCFSVAAKKVKKQGHLVLSSCSSHISFEDFNIIITEALSKSRKTGRILRVSGQGFDHPYPHACPQLRYLKFVDLIIS